MATSASPVRDTQARPPAPPSKAEHFVETQLHKARQRVRATEFGKAAIVCFLLMAGYSVVVALLDRWLQLPSLTRQLLFSAICLTLGAYLGWKVAWPAFFRINPYYAARLVEQNLDADKNSLVNWLDLHQQPMAPAFRIAIANQAAKDLDGVNLEQAIATRPGKTALIGGGTFLAVLLLLFASSPQFISHETGLGAFHRGHDRNPYALDFDRAGRR